MLAFCFPLRINMICMHLSFVAGVSYVPAACLLKLQLPLMMHSTNHASATATTYKPPDKKQDNIRSYERIRAMHRLYRCSGPKDTSLEESIYLSVLTLVIYA